MQPQESKKLSEFVRLFNEGKYFESHEILEESWKNASGKNKRFYQGMIQAAVALHHARNRNCRGALYEFRLSLQKLKDLPSEFLGINLKKFRKDLALYFSSSSKTNTFPKI